MSDSSPVRVALLASCTIELLREPLGAALSQRGIAVSFWTAGFGQYRQALLDPVSEIYRFDPEVAVLYLDGEDLFAPALENPFAFRRPQREQMAQERAAELAELAARFRERLPRASLLLNTVSLPPLTSLGSLERNSEFSIQELATNYNDSVAATARQTAGVAIVDVAGFIAGMGYANWHDSRLWYLARSRCSRQAIGLLARRYAAAIGAKRGKMRKCIALDLDHTLWGGIVGEDGVEGLRLGEDGIGLAFAEFQGELLNLQRQGILLALCSKNNADDALQAIRKHPAMRLREEHFAAMRINWENKAVNLRSLAEELNIGLDSIVFLDDNPVERSWVREAIPEVCVPEWPADPSDYKNALLELSAEHFVKFAITTEDLNKGEQYRQQAQRRSFAETGASLEDFYRSLRMRATIAPAAPATIPRIAQLTQKTNQFNLTTRRYTEADIAALSTSADAAVYSLELDDSFGRNGIVGVAILKRQNSCWVIDTFLLSCRVMGRTVENAFLSFVVDNLRHRSAHKLIGEYFPTAKNAPVAGFYPGNGFRTLGTDSNGQRWELDLSRQSVPLPAWFEIIALEDEVHAGQASA